MFNTEDLKCLDLKCFCVIAVDDYDVTIMSRNIGHCWHLHNPGYPREGSVVIFHKHKFSHPHHQHGKANTLRQAVKGIKSHDMIGGRWVEENNTKSGMSLLQDVPYLILIKYYFPWENRTFIVIKIIWT